MKKILAILMVTVLAAAMFTACSNAPAEDTATEAPAEDTATEAPAEETEAPAEAEEPAEGADDAAGSGNVYEIAVVPKDTTNPWFIRMEEGVKRYAEETGQNAFQKGPAEVDAAQQVQVVEDLIAQGVDALCVVPHDPGAMEPVLKKAMEADIVVITHEASSQENCDYDLEAFDFDAYGGYIMDTLAEAMGEEGQYIARVGSLTNDSHNQEADGAIKRQEEAYPNMELIDERIVTDDNPETSYETAKEVLKSYPEVKGFIGTGSYDTPGAGRAIEEAGLIGQVFACGTGMPAANKELLESGAVTALTLWDPAEAAYAMCALATHILDGGEVTDGMSLGLEGYESLIMDGKVLTGAAWVTITKENVDSFGF